MDPRGTRLQIIFLASLAPMALLTTTFGLGTFTVLRQVHADLDQVASAVAQSHAERAVIASFAGRATVRWLKQTPTEIVNTVRMDYSARQLTETARPILEIALDCGLNNLSHFYALFRQRFGVSPRKYRLRAHPTVRG